VFDSAPVTSLKRDDLRTARFLDLAVVVFRCLDRGHRLEAFEATNRDPGSTYAEEIAAAAEAIAASYSRGDWPDANQRTLALSNWIARHRDSTRLIATWKDCWKESKTSQTSAETLDEGRRFIDEANRQLGGPNAVTPP
jgi:hypothetical protein